MQACDICRKRKVKCDRHTPCSRCRRLRQPCTYTDVLRKKGPKFVHSYPSIYTPNTMPDLQLQLQRWEQTDLYTELGNGPGAGMRSGTAVGTGTATAAASGGGSSSSVGGYSDLELDLDPELDMGLEFSRPGDLPPAQRVSPFNMGGESSMMRDLTLYVERLYPLLPVVDIQDLRLQAHAHLSGAGYSPIRLSFLSSLRAAIHAFDLAGTELNHEHERERTCERFLQSALKARAQCDEPQFLLQPQSHYEHEARHKLLSSFFLFLTYWNLRRERHAWWYLRESIALLLGSRLHREDEYRRLEPREAEYRRRLTWGLFVTERTFCLLHNKPIMLRPWIDLPTLPSVFDEEGVMAGFVRLVTLSRGVDVDMSGCWTAAGFVTPVTLNLAPPQGHNYDGTDAGLLPIQALDLGITREWLRAKRWRFGIPQGQFSEFVASRDNSVWRLDEPLLIGQSLLEILQGSKNVLEVLWSSIVDHKLCDICECLYDILPVMQTRGRAGEAELDQLLRGLLEVLSRFRGRSSYLLTKART
ncbi:hypothetical protein BJX63DRAFT_428816 [Aspergillus granulosus]|uniref:Zn(2)-C6 fungal-type domain-containing protein n=1 Tax=Aspergillus granulosus TaxID=176169 RepID=A0ABR4HWR8_9EURO